MLCIHVCIYIYTYIYIYIISTLDLSQQYLSQQYPPPSSHE